MTTDQSTEQTTSTPINITKQMSISLDESNQLNFTLSDTWSVHEAFGVLFLAGINLYINNLSPVRGLHEKLDHLIQTSSQPATTGAATPSMSDLLMAAAEQLKTNND